MALSSFHTALPGYFSLQEAADYLGYVDTSSLRKKCIAGKIIAYKVGKTWLLPEQVVFDEKRKEPLGTGNRGLERK